MQPDLFTDIGTIYGQHEAIDNDTLVPELAHGACADTWALRADIGKAAKSHNVMRRKVRWHQQTLKQLGLIERVEGQRGVWRATAKGRDELTPAAPSVVMLAFSTELGIALWADCKDVFTKLGEPIHLVLTSPPYPLARPRAYGNPTQEQYTDFVCGAMEPLVKHLVPGGSICLNISNDIFLSGLPARSLYRERMVIALHDRLGLYKMDEFIWADASKAPGPIAWASKKRYQLNTAWEPIYWFTNDPSACRSDNRRVLQPHTDKHKKLIANGGAQRIAQYGDGSNRLKHESFSTLTAGSIAKNVFAVAHRCPSQGELRKQLAAQGLPMHGATMPLKLASTLVQFLTEPDDLVVDPFGGWMTTPLAAEDNGRRWIATERFAEYAFGSGVRFKKRLLKLKG